MPFVSPLLLLMLLSALEPWSAAAQDTSESSISNPLECVVGDVDSSVDLFPSKVQPTEAKSFSVEYFNTYKIVKNLDSDSSYLLYQCGTEVPSDIDTSAFDEILSIPISSVGLSQTTMIPFMEQLGKLDNIAFFLTDPIYNSSPCFRQRINNGDVWLLQDGPPDSELTDPITDDGANFQTPSDLVAFMSPFDSYINTTVTRILLSEYSETTNKAIFEWLYFYSVFFNAEDLAKRVIQSVDDQYNCVSEAVASVMADNTPPTVLWAYYSEFCEGWAIGSCPSYYCEFAADSGAELVQVEAGFGSIIGQGDCFGSTFLTIDELVEVGKDAEYWFFPAPYWDRTYALFEDELSQMESVRNQKVYDYQEAGENAWFQERLAEYYNVFHDFCATVKTCPSYVGPGWFRNVFTESVGGEGTCADEENRFPFFYETCDLISNVVTDGGPDESESGSSSFSLVWQRAMSVLMLIFAMFGIY